MNESNLPIIWSVVYVTILIIITVRNSTNFLLYAQLQEDLCLLLKVVPDDMKS